MQKVEEILLSFDPSMVVVGVVVVKCSQDLVFLFSLVFINKTQVFRIVSTFFSSRLRIHLFHSLHLTLNSKIIILTSK